MEKCLKCKRPSCNLFLRWLFVIGIQVRVYHFLWKLLKHNSATLALILKDREWHQFRESVQEKNVKEFDFCSNPLPRLSKMREVEELLSRKAFEKLATHQDLSNAIEKVFFRSEFLKKKVVLFSKKLFHHPSFASLVYVKNRVSSSNIDFVFWIIVCIKPLFYQ